MVTMRIESNSDATLAQIIIGGFLSYTTYHKYEDDYHNHTAFTTDVDGKYTYIQDLSRKHHVFIQPRPSTRFINVNATGGDCTLIGTWDSDTKTCTLTDDLTESVQIDSDGITLNGNGQTITGSNTGYGVYLPGRTGVTIKNINIEQFYYGIYLGSPSNNNTLSGNTARSNKNGISLYSSSNNMLEGNTASSNNWNGISLYSSSNNMLGDNTASSNNWNGISLYYSGNNTLTGNDASNNDYVDGISVYNSSNNKLIGNTANSNRNGISLYSSSNNMLDGNTASSNRNGISLYSSSNNTLTKNTLNWNIYNFVLSGLSYPDFDNQIETNNLVDGKIVYYVKGAVDTVYDSTANAGTFYCISCVNVTIKNLDLKNNGYGVFFWNTTRSKIQNVHASNNGYGNGISLYYSNYNTLRDNTASSNSYHGIYLESSGNNMLSGNTASSNNWKGISLSSSSNNMLIGNDASNNVYGDGISLNSSSNNTLSGNTARSNKDYGISLSSSSNNTLTKNTLNENGYNFKLSGLSYPDFDNQIDTSNLVDGETVYYVKGAVDTVYDSTANAGTFYCISCVNVTIKNLDLKYNYYGIFLWNTTLSKIQNVNAHNNSNGIYLYSSSNNTLIGNDASNNIYGNGISLYTSSNNTLSGNNASLNRNGISLSYSSNNIIHNNYFNNTNNAYDNGNNIWNIARTYGKNIIGGQYLGGNYWSDYTGIDTNGDGLGDTMLPHNSGYKIAKGGDYFPLTATTIPFAVSINISEIPLIDHSTSNILNVEYTNFNSSDTYNISIIAPNGEIVYSDSGNLSGISREIIPINWIPSSTGNYIIEAWGRNMIYSTTAHVTDSRVVSPVPEPGTFILVVTGILGLIGIRRRYG